MILNRKQKEDLVIDLLNQGISFPQIAKQAHVSFTDIKRIRQKATGDDKETDEEAEKEKKAKSIPSQAFELFLEGMSPVQVAIDLDLETDRVMSILSDFLRLNNMHKVATILKEHKNQLAPFVKLIEELKRNTTRVKDIRCAMNNINNIKVLEQRKSKLKEEIHSLKEERDQLEIEIFNAKETLRYYHLDITEIKNKPYKIP